MKNFALTGQFLFEVSSSAEFWPIVGTPGMNTMSMRLKELWIVGWKSSRLPSWGHLF